jgi:integrase
MKAQVNRVRSQLIAALNWAIDERGYLQSNPAARVRRRKLETSGTRVLKPAEIRAIWTAAERASQVGRSLIQLLLLTGQRRDEIRCMQWSEIDLDQRLWVLPAARNKAKRDHAVPLSLPALEILKKITQDSAFVLTLSGRKPFAGHQQLKAALERTSKVTGWRLHDARRTVSSGLAELHIPQDTIDAVLGHAKKSLSGVYNRYDYLEPKRAALELWAKHVTAIVSGAVEASNVSKLQRATA